MCIAAVVALSWLLRGYLMLIPKGYMELDSFWAIILCGGRGSRLWPITKTCPKPLVAVHGRPLLWYIFLNLYKQGFRKYLFPLGYRGSVIKKYIIQEFKRFDGRFCFLNTGRDTPTAKRLQAVSNKIEPGSDFFILNGDTYFDFDIREMYQLHKRTKSLLTLSSTKIILPHGIIIGSRNKITGFARHQEIEFFSLKNYPTLQGYINAGFVWMNKSVLEMIDLSNHIDFEIGLYDNIVKLQRAAHYRITGDWFAIDTLKDLTVINSTIEAENKIGDSVKSAKTKLELEYYGSNVR